MDDKLVNYFGNVVMKLGILKEDVGKMIASKTLETDPTKKKSHEQGASQQPQVEKAAHKKNEPLLKSIRPLTILRNNEQEHKDAEKNPDETYVADRLKEIFK